MPDPADIGETITLDGREFARADILCDFLALLVAQAEDRPENLLLTYPPGLSGSDALVAAAEAAGFDEVELLPRPLATAVGVLDTIDTNDVDTGVVVVHDVGATATTSLVRLNWSARSSATSPRPPRACWPRAGPTAARSGRSWWRAARR
ncbi:hypothetical protein V5P93_004370 [Actinokineospora auranticolor]|uniref:Uncharacterized protein n=1 Tax=Actinokineospora auranticolor TaxID=155976 RepID=A0A2S6GTF2_9PSEU|nr:hypothetical protein [Actinokineospora auranticolor]PPK68522.1 hypothetical protein CLV40_105251 [Actinokineospora auranticolor]